MNLIVGFNDDISCPKGFNIFSGKLTICLLSVYIQSSALMCLVINQTPQDVQLRDHFWSSYGCNKLECVLF